MNQDSCMAVTKNALSLRHSPFRAAWALSYKLSSSQQVLPGGGKGSQGPGNQLSITHLAEITDVPIQGLYLLKMQL